MFKNYSFCFSLVCFVTRRKNLSCEQQQQQQQHQRRRRRRRQDADACCWYDASTAWNTACARTLDASPKRTLILSGCQRSEALRKAAFRLRLRWRRSRLASTPSSCGGQGMGGGGVGAAPLRWLDSSRSQAASCWSHSWRTLTSSNASTGVRACAVVLSRRNGVSEGGGARGGGG